MSIMKYLVDFLGMLFQILLIILFFNTIWIKTVDWKKTLLIKAIFVFSIMVALVLVNNQMIRLMLNFILIYYISFIYKSNVLTKIMFSIITFVIFAVSEVVTGLTLSIIANMTVRNTQESGLTYFMGAFVSKLVAIIIIRLIGFFVKSDYQSNNRFTLSMLFYPLSSFVLSIILYVIVYDMSDINVIILSQIAIIIIAVANILIFYIIEKQTQSELATQQIAFIKEQLSAQINHYTELSKSQNETRKIWHDMKNNLTAVNGLLGANNIREARNYIDRITGDVSSIINITNTGIPTLDAILTAKTLIAKELNICIDCKIIVEQEIKIDQMDISIIIANALDNAIEATSKITAQDRIIKIVISTFSAYLSIVIENPFSDIVSIDKIVTIKKDKSNHGFGLKGIKSVASKYDGDVDIKILEDMFRLSVILKNT